MILIFGHIKHFKMTVIISIWGKIVGKKNFYQNGCKCSNSKVVSFNLLSL